MMLVSDVASHFTTLLQLLLLALLRIFHGRSTEFSVNFPILEHAHAGIWHGRYPLYCLVHSAAMIWLVNPVRSLTLSAG
ncbi:MAG: hypothetical protein J3Q66DRAFT_343928 [Benniella sp.]|nr:MAG: hypothetical protein J3Q66DRAFT_343928 [Benniella sp.]